jgi:hypothetical protein
MVLYSTTPFFLLRRNKKVKDKMGKIEINGEIYVKELELRTERTKEYVIVRTYSAGVFAGYLQSRDGKEVVLREARRLWYWKGAASLSQLAREGVKEPKECKFPCCVDKITLTETIEIIACSKKARESIVGVPIWEM